jgi:hypothetical protein
MVSTVVGVPSTVRVTQTLVLDWVDVVEDEVEEADKLTDVDVA